MNKKRDKLLVQVGYFIDLCRRLDGFFNYKKHHGGFIKCWTKCFTFGENEIEEQIKFTH